ncbi:MocR-like pyridoxine biosynthesis transcription factor PdxR [Kineococcus sp. SYSU DK004]|uniref:MocR-like pyridoxine biosynthesis transcription factor PdxR n=1 Tax=Kineococcus sp. SYSU DK004 TaxID=3383125 RepID=UPI003D7C6B6A
MDQLKTQSPTLRMDQMTRSGASTRSGPSWNRDRLDADDDAGGAGSTPRSGGRGSDFLQLDPTAAPTRGRSAWLAARLREAITTGRVPDGAVLPPTRALAVDLGWARGVVVEAYQRLGEEGLTTGRARGGTRVRLPPTHPAGPRPRTAPSSAGTSPDPPAGRAPACTSAPVLDLTPGVPDLTRFPRAAWLRAERSALHTAGPDVLRYGGPAGDPGLRQRLVSWLALHRGISTTPEDVVIVAGVAQALALTAHVLRRRGLDRIGVEDPGSRGARDELAYWGLDPVPVPVDEHGLRTDLLPALLPSTTGRPGGAVPAGGRPRGAVVVTPAHQYPTGVPLSPARRVELLRWASEHDGLIVEDDYDAEHRYDRTPTASVHAAAPDRVLHTGSVSKTLAPALRLGWVVAPTWLRTELLEAKHASDISNPSLPQLVLAQMLSDGSYERHLRLTRRHQRGRRDEFVSALHRALPTARVGGLAAGLHLVLDLSGHDLDDVELADRLARRGVVVDTLSRHRVRPGPPGLVLGYAGLTPQRLRAAADRIAATVSDLR